MNSATAARRAPAIPLLAPQIRSELELRRQLAAS